MNTETENTDKIYTTEEALELFNDWIDEVNGDVEILGYPYEASRVLKETDPIAYRVTFSDWIDSQNRGGERFLVEGYF